MAIKLLVATPAYGDVFYTPYVESILKLVRFLHAQKWEFAFRSISYAEIGESRNYLLTNWFDKTDASHMLFVDADMGFEPKLISDLVEFDKPVLGVAYPKRSLDLLKVAELAASGMSPEAAVSRAQEFVFRPLPGAPKIERDFMEVDGCGTGIFLLQRSCIETMLKACPQLSDSQIKKGNPLTKGFDRLIRAFDSVEADGYRLSEDLSFCHRWRSLCKGRIWVNVGYEITHFGHQRFAGKYEASALSIARPLRVGQTVKGQLPRPKRG